MLYGYLFMRFYGGDDTWQFHTLSLVEYNKLLHHPLQFIRDTFTETGGSFSLDAAYSTTNSFWNDFEEVIFIRMLVLFDVLSFGNYYVNVVLFCFVIYLGHLLLYKLMAGYQPEATNFLLAGIFFYPVVLFWVSGIRKEGLLLLGMATVLYYFDKLMQRKGRFITNILVCGAALVMLWLIRNMVVLCLAPALLAWFLRSRTGLRSLVVYPVVYGLCFCLFFFGDLVPHVPDMAQKLADRQHSFNELQGNTRLSLDSLDSTPFSYIRVLPQALNHGFFQPYLWQSKSPLHLVSALDVFLFFGFGAFCFYCRKKDWKHIIRSPLVMTCLLTALAGYLIVGYTIPFPGAFVRYKSIFEILFISCFAAIAGNSGLSNIRNIYILKFRRR